jgi:hypothetical protein
MTREGYRKLRFRWWRRHLLARKARGGHEHRQASSRKSRADRAGDDAFGFRTQNLEKSDHVEPTTHQEVDVTSGSTLSAPGDVAEEPSDRTGVLLGGPREPWPQSDAEADKGGSEEIGARDPGTDPFWADIHDRIGALRQRVQASPAGSADTSATSE